QAWQAEDVLYRLADGLTPPEAPLKADAAARKKARDAWAAWWREQGGKIDLAKLQERPKSQGLTLVVLLDIGRMMELGRANQPRWTIDNLIFPLDAEVLPNDRVLVAEYHANRVTERDTKGEVKWEKKFETPQAAQRLANGHTFIVSDARLAECDKDGQEVFT